MNTERISIESIVEKAHTWRRPSAETYIASVDIGFNEYEDHIYKRTELISLYGDLVDVIDATLDHAAHPTLQGNPALQSSTVCLGRGIEMLRQHQLKAPMHYVDERGLQQFIHQIYEFYSYDEAEDSVLLVIERYTLDVNSNGIVYVDNFKESNVTLPMALLEEHYPNCRGRLKAALGIGLKCDVSDASFVQYVCQPDMVEASVNVESLPTDMLSN